MKVHDYFSEEDANDLTDEEYEAFRMYLRFLGHRVSDEYGHLDRYGINDKLFFLLLYEDGDLSWADEDMINRHGKRQLTLDEIRSLSKMGMV